ncbi:hypothetical protein CERZMDRAFT_99735 [Cercospora zeae-maydis SCOH1-5]|uniref:Pentacotripeptide-repeat region of PRORP domain-containing protein n=1 Tax=Cercospora zeae-maydis SCOH1-5 TaxID=717836 RepID=A0A6A6F9F4_9PEZI|nr:hypothetical protein CERZMDRAFT_99735 [Cercospora zeae-maydis SCOH1-5]
MRGAFENNNRLPQWRRLYSTSTINTTNTAPEPQRDAPRNELPPNANHVSADSTFLNSIAGAGDDELPRKASRKKLPPDLNHVSAESTSLDFILGPGDDELPRKRPAGRDSYTRLGFEVEQEHKCLTAPLSRRQRRARLRGSQQLSHARSRQSPTKINGPQEPSRVSVNFRRGTNIGERTAAPKRSTSLKGRMHRNNNQQRSTWMLSKRRPSRIDTRRWQEFLEHKRWTTKVHQMCICIQEQREATAPVLSPTTIELVDQTYDLLAQNPPLPVPGLRTTALWRSVALWFMYYDPTTGADFLLMTKSRETGLTPRKIAIGYLARVYLRTRDNDSLRKLVDALPDLPSTDAQAVSLLASVRAYKSVLAVCTAEALHILYSDFKKKHLLRGQGQAWRTWLSFAAAFSRHGNGTQALDALFEAKRSGGELNYLLFHKVCAALVRRSLSFPGGIRACIDIVDSLTKLGVSLNTKITNVIMLNAVEADELKTALAIYRSMRGHGLQPDMYTFAILLKACKMRIGDAEMLSETINDALRDTNVLEAPAVATEILHCLALHHTQFHPEKSFLTVADAYAQLFNLGSLRLVGLLPDKLAQIEESTAKLQPEAQDIYIVLSTYLEQCSTARDSITRAYDMWQRFKRAMESGQEPFASMAQTDYVYNAFLAAFTRTKRGLLHAAEVIKYMQLPNDPSAKFQRSRPTVQSWTIFVYGFSRHGQMHLAEQVQTYMRSKGIEPNLVTYNSLLFGYASKQRLDGVLRSVQRLQTDGYTWDSWTQSALGLYRNQDRLRARMQAEGLDFTPDLKRTLGAKVEAFISSDDDTFIQSSDDDAMTGKQHTAAEVPVNSAGGDNVRQPNDAQGASTSGTAVAHFVPPQLQRPERLEADVGVRKATSATAPSLLVDLPLQKPEHPEASDVQHETKPSDTATTPFEPAQHQGQIEAGVVETRAMRHGTEQELADVQADAGVEEMHSNTSAKWQETERERIEREYFEADNE